MPAGKPDLSAHARETFSFVEAVLGEAKRVIEVGCGDGELAAALGERGFHVTGIELDLERAAQARERDVEVRAGDWLAIDLEPCDACLFTRSLHHVSDLERAIARAKELVVPGGVLVLEEFDFERTDERTLHWYYANHAAVRGEEAPKDDLAARWLHEHEHDPPLHTGEAMLGAVRAAFDDVDVRRGAYLWRSIAPPDVAPDAVTEAFLALETSLLELGRILPSGLRIVARRAP